MSEETPEIKYQWTKGEKINTVEILEEEKTEKNIEWLYFRSGHRINKSLLTDYMIKLLPGQEGLRSELDIDEINTDPTKKPVQKHIPNPLGEVAITKQPSKSKKSPMRELLEKASKTKNSERNISLKFKVFYPKKTTYNVLKESFGSDVKKEIIDHIYDQIINESSFKKELIKTIKDLVNSTYDSKK